MFDGSTMKGIRAAVSSYAASFDPGEISAQVAQGVVEDAIAVENMVATVKALAAKRVADTELWKREGDISPAHHLARKSGTSLAKAKEELGTAAGLAQLPELEAAARSGEVSSSQAGAIADAATKNPKEESRLMKTAKKGSLFQLKQECEAAKAAVERDPDARQAAIHRSRFLRQRRTSDGAGEVVYRSTLQEVAEMMSIVRGFAQRVFEKARAEGRREPEEAYLADGLLNAARAGAAAARSRAGRPSGGAAGGGPSGGAAGGGPAGGAPKGGGPDSDRAPHGTPGRGPKPGWASDAGSGAAATESTLSQGAPSNGSLFDDEPDPRSAATGSAGGAEDEQDPADPLSPPVHPAKVIVRIDWEALVRGWPADEEICDMTGVGVVPVSVVREMIACGDVFLAAIVTKGKDVVNVAHLGRRPSASQRTALDWMNPSCSAWGCNNSVRLEMDHRQDWSDTRITLLSLMDGLCGHHHRLKTYQGWMLVEGSGKRPMVPPDDPRHPKARAGPAPPFAESG